jgi:hypothetical protein
MIPASERYLHDPAFHNLVDTIYHYMETLELTPHEMREAVMLAAIKFEMNNIRPILMTHADIQKYNERMYGVKEWDEKVTIKGVPPSPERWTY